MSNNKKFNLIVLTCLIVITSMITGDAFAQTSSKSGFLINAANELVREGKITEAIDAYSEIGPTAELDEKLNYNLAIAHYRNGDSEAAATLFTKVAGSPNKTLASDSQYNLGNCHYSKALQQVESDKPATISNLKDAISFYRGSLRGNPNNADARANIELAGELMKQLKDEQQQDQQKQDQQSQDQQDQNQQKQDQQKQDQQKQDQQNQDQQNQDQDQQNQDQQNQGEQSQDQSEESDSKNESGGSQQKPEQKKPEESKSDDPQNQQQQSESEDSKSENSPSENPEQNESSEKQDSKDDQSNSQGNTRRLPKQNQKPDRESDNKNQTADEQTDSGDEEKQKPVPSGELKAANEQDKTDGTGMAAGTIQDEKDGLMTREEALKMLQSVRDRDMLRRLKQQQRERSRRVPVDKDW